MKEREIWSINWLWQKISRSLTISPICRPFRPSLFFWQACDLPPTQGAALDYTYSSPSGPVTRKYTMSLSATLRNTVAAVTALPSDPVSIIYAYHPDQEWVDSQLGLVKTKTECLALLDHIAPGPVETLNFTKFSIPMPQDFLNEVLDKILFLKTHGTLQRLTQIVMQEGYTLSSNAHITHLNTLYLLFTNQLRIRLPTTAEMLSQWPSSITTCTPCNAATLLQTQLRCLQERWGSTDHGTKQGALWECMMLCTVCLPSHSSPT